MPTARPSTAPATPTRVSGSDQSSPARGTAPRLLAAERGRHAVKAGGARGAAIGLQLHVAGGALGACFAMRHCLHSGPNLSVFLRGNLAGVGCSEATCSEATCPSLPCCWPWLGRGPSPYVGPSRPSLRSGELSNYRQLSALPIAPC